MGNIKFLQGDVLMFNSFKKLRLSPKTTLHQCIKRNIYDYKPDSLRKSFFKKSLNKNMYYVKRNNPVMVTISEKSKRAFTRQLNLFESAPILIWMAAKMNNDSIYEENTFYQYYPDYKEHYKHRHRGFLDWRNYILRYSCCLAACNKEGTNNNKEEKEMARRYADTVGAERDNSRLYDMMRRAGLSVGTRLNSSAHRIINVDAIYNNVERWTVDKIKSHFGREFKLYNSCNMKESIHLKEFLEKYDKNFDKHVNNNTLLDFNTICFLETGTFMYLATGRFIPAKMDYTFMNKDTEDVYMYIFGHSSPKYWKELEKVIEMDSTKDKGGLIFTVSRVHSGSYNITSMDLHKRGFDKLYFSNGEVDAVKKHLDRFKETYEMYNSKQLNYKTGILLYGDPGTGKTSLAKAIASEYNRSICAITISSIADIDFAELATMINNDVVDTYIVLFEDIDTIENALSTREVAESKKKSSKYDIDDDEDEQPVKSRNDVMNALMQFLDGVNSPNNVIFVATTNYVDRLDSAFVRAGRFDLKIEVKPLDKQDAMEFAKSFDISEETAYKVIKEYEETYPKDDHYNQAKLQGIIIKYIK